MNDIKDAADAVVDGAKDVADEVTDTARDMTKSVTDLQDRLESGILAKIRDLVIRYFSVVVWISFAIALWGVLGSLFHGHFSTALSRLTSAIMTAGIAFVVLDIRNRLMK